MNRNYSQAENFFGFTYFYFYSEQSGKSVFCRAKILK